MIRKFLLLLLLCSGHPGMADQPSLVPAPANLQRHNGFIRDLDRLVMLSPEPEAEGSFKLFQSWYQMTFGTAMPVVNAPEKNRPYIQLVVLPDTASEAYTLSIQSHIQLSGGRAGIVRGLSTLIQLLWQYRHQNKLPRMTINDQPVFSYRGVHLDVCRHFAPKEFVLRYIDLIAFHKMNTFHWHLTEDQGWRIEIKRYPELTRVGAWRNGSMVGPYRNQQYDTLRYGGYYTQEEIREVVAYAQQRGITVIPEIEMPGHSVAALAAYPEYSCTGQVKEVARGWGVFDDVFCVKDSTFDFLQNILTEVMELFPSKYIHIGGDECPKVRWKECPRCQATKALHGLKDEHELQSYFIQRIEKFLNANGRSVIGWDEILEGGLAPNATVMSWRGEEGGIAAARSAHYAIMTPGSHCYFDHYQGERSLEPLAFGGYTTLEKVYAYKPIPDSLTKQQRRYILGAQANLWTEYMYDTKQVEYMLFPRLLALSEVLWLPESRRDEKDFLNRVSRHYELLDTWKVNASRSWLRPEMMISGGKTLPSLEVSFRRKADQKLFVRPAGSNAWKKVGKKLHLTQSGPMQVKVISKADTVLMKYDFTFSKATGAAVTLPVPGSRSYANPGSTLTNGIIDGYPWSGKHWVGWYGKSGEAVVDLGREQRVDSIVVVYLHDPVSWIHAPGSVELTVDNSILKSDLCDRSAAINRVTLPVGKALRSLPLRFNSIGKNPQGSAGAGEDGWLFVTEILVY